jgi:SAM-dependent methyltransferase
MLGPAPPAAAVLDVVRHVLGQLAPALPRDASAWERLWAATARPPWHADAVEPPLAEALAERGGRLVELGCGDGLVAIEAARRGFRVTATDVAPTALARARARAGTLPILFALDDVTASLLDERFDVAVDRGLLHCLPREAWPAYAHTVGELVVPDGRLLLVAHAPGGERGTIAITEADLPGVLPAFQLERAVPTKLAGGDAQLYIMRRCAR